MHYTLSSQSFIILAECYTLLFYLDVDLYVYVCVLVKPKTACVGINVPQEQIFMSQDVNYCLNQLQFIS